MKKRKMPLAVKNENNFFCPLMGQKVISRFLPRRFYRIEYVNQFQEMDAKKRGISGIRPAKVNTKPYYQKSKSGN
jgi:hypothetical protein